MVNQNTELQFSKLRSWLFPIHNEELKKVLSLGIMLALIVFNFWVGHNSKDVLVIMAPESGAEALNYLKLPAFLFSVIFIMVYTWLTNRFSQHTIFQTVVAFFLCFYAIFTFLIYPNQDYFHMSPDQIAALKETYPRVKGMFPVIGYWGFSLFYIFSELWGAIVLTLLFWQLANQLSTIKQSKRFYMLFGSFNGLGTLAAGYFALYYSRPEAVGDGQSVNYQATFVEMMKIFMGVCVLIMGLYYWISHNVVKRKEEYDPHKKNLDDQHKIQLSFWESLKYISASKYIGYIAIISIAYNIALNFVEVSWKSQLKELHSTHFGFQEYLGNLTTYLGMITVIMGMLGSKFVRRFSWQVSALVTPIVALIFGGIFFYMNWQSETPGFLAFLSMTPLMLSVWVGLFFDLFYRSSKYSFFNATREMAFIPLDAELKIKGKAAVDIMTGRIGKMGASIIQAGLLSVVTGGTQGSIIPYLGIAFFTIIAIWIICIRNLNKEFITLTNQ